MLNLSRYERLIYKCTKQNIMMLGSKGILPPMIPRIAPHFMLPQS